MTATYNGVGRSEGWENLAGGDRRESHVNVGLTERWMSGLVGATLVAWGLARRRLRSLLLPVGGTLIGRAVTGRCVVNRALGRNSARSQEHISPVASLGQGEGVRVERSITIDRPREELFRFWRNLENLPRFMDHLQSVTVLDEDHSHWVAKGPAGTRVEWDAEIHNEIENELLAWRSLPGAEVDHAGSVHFSPAPDGGTMVRVLFRYDPPAGAVGSAVARLFGEEPSQQVADDLRRLKQVTEASEPVA
ncbi:MAG: SRPBCC family protein [Gemmatimonadales bacterium]